MEIGNEKENKLKIAKVIINAYDTKVKVPIS